MTERTPPPDPDLAAYLLGKLEPRERARFEQRLSEEPALREAAAELEGTVELLNQAAQPFEVPPGLEAGTFRALEREIAASRGQPATRAPARRRRFRRPALRPLALAGGVALALAAAVLVGTQLGGDDELPGTPELEAALLAPNGQTAASADVRETPLGRVVRLRSDDLPVLPTSDFYELWFVGPGDQPGDPNRISAGTFHPDAQGNSDVVFHAAVDPSKYPVIAVTEEPGDGDPGPTRPDVLRSGAR